MRPQIVTIQESFEDIMMEVEDGVVPSDSFWVTLRGLGDENREEIKQDYYDIEIHHRNQVSSSEGVTFERLGKHSYSLAINGISFKLKTPKRWLGFGGKSTYVTAASFSLHSRYLVAGDDNGRLKIFDLDKGKITRIIDKAHPYDVLHTMFFPSGKVYASVGLNMEIKIWGLDSEKSVRTMSAQQGIITDIKSVGTKGRNFLTSCKDGSVVLWECGSGADIHSFRRIDDLTDPANCLTIGDIDDHIHARSSLEFEIDGKALYVGYQSGIVQQFHLADHSQTRVSFGDKDGNSVEAIELLASYLITGHSNGDVKVWDTDTQDLVCNVKLRENVPVSIIKGISYNEMSDLISIIVYNGKDFLINASVDISTGDPQDITYLVGFAENAAISCIDKSDNHLVVSGSDGILAIFDI